MLEHCDVKAMVPDTMTWSLRLRATSTTELMLLATCGNRMIRRNSNAQSRANCGLELPSHLSYHTIYNILYRIIPYHISDYAASFQNNFIYMFCNRNCLGTHLFFSFSDIILLEQSCVILLYDLLGHVVSLSKLHLRDWHLRKCMVYEEKTKKEDTVYHRNTIFHWYKWFSREHLGQNLNRFGPCSRLVDRNGKCKK